VDQAPSGAKGLERIEQAAKDRPYDLVLMDWKMEGMDGIETSLSIRKGIDLKQHPKIILVTAYAQDEAIKEVEKADLNGLLIKPVSSSSLFNTIMQAFGKVEARRLVATVQKDQKSDMVRSIRGARILLVEDNEINQQVAQEILEGEGFVVTIANDGREGVDWVQKAEFDAVLMDIQMPTMDGYEATREIRQDLRFKDLPILAMTAGAMAQDRENAYEAGMNDHVSKPINLDELFSALINWIKPGEREVPEHLAAKIEEKPEEKSLTDMPGISVTEGLARVGGNINLYRKILAKFTNDYTDATEQIKDALDKGDQELAQRLAHTVKGVAGNIGAKDLSGPAGELEASIKHGKVDELDKLLGDFSDALNVVLTSLKHVVEDESETEKEKTESVAADPKRLLELLLKLEPHLKKRKPKPCKEVMEEINGYSWPDEYTQDIVKLDQLIGKYKFKDAHPILESIVEKLKPQMS
jgi:CheY-like chemotaxis protein